MADPVPATIQDLLTGIYYDRSLAHEVLSKLPNLITESGDVTFDLDTPVLVPSIPKLQEAMQAGGLNEINSRVALNARLVQGLIQEVTRQAKLLEGEVASPFWRSLDLTDNADGRTTDVLWRAQVGDGIIRYPYEAFDKKRPLRKFDTQGVFQGDMLLAPYTENATLEKRYSSAPAVSNVVNINAYPAFTRTVTRYRRQYYRYYYGYYYYWWRYIYRRWAYGSYIQSYTATVTSSLSSSMTAQTFQVNEPRVCVGINFEVLNPGGTKTAAQPKVLLCRTEQGAPMLDQVVVEGTLRDDANAANTSTTATTLVHFDFEKPILLDAGTSYAIVLSASATWNVGYSSNEDASGGVFYSQDLQYWTSDLAKDLCFALRVADFGAGVTSFTIELQPLSLSGGIGSLSFTKAVYAPPNADVSVEIDVNNNGNWSPLASLEDIQSLPTFTPLRAVFTSTDRYAMPILDTAISEITAFRPATTFKYISKDRALPNSSTLEISYTLYGFDDTDPSQPIHQFNPRLKMVDGPLTTIDPTTLTIDRSEDGNVSQFKAIFTIPAGATIFRHDISGSTLTANTLYDISPVVEMF